jgi:gamma-glutamylcysteine synthetase|tara:strand:- start:309 stop:485 length:177 start_codon:yes stop_codon:yes gene_type:complete
MDEKTNQYVNNLIRLLTQQRNEAMDLNVKLQVELAMAKAEVAEATKKEEKPKEEKKDK